MKLLGLMAAILLFLYVIDACDNMPAQLKHSHHTVVLETDALPQDTAWHVRLAAQIRDDARLIISALAESNAPPTVTHLSAA